ncbi:MAG TPA: exosome complex protein Rrp42 [Candidatus Thermoplasmatota archaeon]|nr:exosome complex protein Rrp42 [Candidatus Thermoplasmatota archaeon]
MGQDIVATIKKDYVGELARQGKRVDGRALDEYRPITIETGVISQAEGSAHVTLGHTEVFVGIKMATGTPYPDSPDSGTLTSSAELVPMASPDFEKGPPSPEAIELARVVDRGIRESKTVDMHKLCITAGEKIWMLYLDMHVVDFDGNLFDACSLGAIAALKTATVPASKHKLGEDFPMPVDHTPVMTTAIKLAPGFTPFDPGQVEEKVGGARLSVSTDENGDIRAMQKGREGGLTRDEIRAIISGSKRKGAEVRAVLHDAIRK